MDGFIGLSIDSILVSVIVPVYNREATILDCLRSIAAQTHSYLEIIVVDGGSTDNTVAFVQELLARDNRIVLLQSPVRGAIAQRSLGVQFSHGEYIQFVDSDDIVSPMFVELPLRNAIENGCDIATFSFSESGSFGCERSGRVRKVLKGREYLRFLRNIRNVEAGISCCTKLVSRSVALKACRFYNAKANEIKCWEDAIYTYAVYLFASSCCFGDYALYYYRKLDSLSHASKLNNYDLFDNAMKLTDVLRSIFESTCYARYAGQASIFLFFALTILLKDEANRSGFWGFRRLFARLLDPRVSNAISKLSQLQKEFTRSEKALLVCYKHKMPWMAYLILKRVARS